jgi:hypothetical protein
MVAFACKKILPTNLKAIPAKEARDMYSKLGELREHGEIFEVNKETKKIFLSEQGNTDTP